MSDLSTNCDIAIVGLAGRFPGAADVTAFWRNLCDGVESISHFDPAELQDDFDAATRASSNFVRARSVLDDVDAFDAGFFGMQSREADLTDPQHRVFIECCWQALEDAGYDPKGYAGAIGVVAGCSINTYFLRNVLRDPTATGRFTSDYQVGSYPELLGAGHDFLATRVAYKLDLRGPSMTLQSACSTSLNCIAQACQNLLVGQADMMLAGAVSITFPQQRGYVYQAGGMVSPDGHCRTFDADAGGTVFGAGAGVVVLKRYADARADGDAVYARIRGFGVNNDGAAKVGYTAPSIDGQAKAIAAAHAMAGVEPSDVHFIECHGTATPLGDPIEFSALTGVFGSSVGGAKTCALGSVKTNIGHLDVAAGMSSLIKTALVLKSGTIPPTLHFKTPNPRIDLEHSPFWVNTTAIDWPSTRSRRVAGVSAFGVGGTNVHLVLENAPDEPAAPADGPQLVVVSARSSDAVRTARERLAARFANMAESDLESAAHTLQSGRRAFPYRFATVAHDIADAVAKLAAVDRTPSGSSTRATGDPAVAFMFPGQGAQYPEMGRELYAKLPAFRSAIDRCADVLGPVGGHDLRTIIAAEAPAGIDLASTDIAQPAIFAVEYALAQVWLDWGLRPSAMIGHSVGEFVAACLAGVMRLEDALTCVAERGRSMRALPGGAMLAVRLPAADLEPLLDGTEIAAINAPALCVAAGSFAAVDALEQRLRARDVTFRRLETSHAFHSAMVEPVIEPLTALLERCALAAPRIPYVSTATGTWIGAPEATSPSYWARHCRQPVRFADGLGTLVESGITALVEVGPGVALATFARQGAGRDLLVTTSLPGKSRAAGADADVAGMLTALGDLWAAGFAPNWPALHRGRAVRRISLPTYPFERKRHWIDAPIPAPQPAAPHTDPVPSTPLETTALATTPAPQSNAGPALAAQANLENAIALILEELSGEEIVGTDPTATFLALGFDSLSLGRFATQVQNAFGVGVTFRQLLGDYPSITALAEHILAVRPPVASEAAPVSANGAPDVQAPAATAATPAAFAPGPAPAVPSFSAPGHAMSAGGSAVEALMRDQLAVMQQLMRDQLNALTGASAPAATSPAGSAAATAPSAAAAAPASTIPAAPAAATAAISAVAAPAVPAAATPATKPAAAGDGPSRFEVFRPGAGDAAQSDLTPSQRAHIDDLIARTVARTGRSKADTQAARAALADPRVAAGFRSEWKEMVYPITCIRAKGSRLWDLDGNEYIDLLNGFGQTAFGHSPDFVVKAVQAQLERGFAIGPQTDLARKVAELFCELTGNERVTFCNTGSEAVMAALRLARTVTGRDRVVVFNGAYHGQFDEVLVKGARTSHRALPVAPGIPSQSVANMTVLPYATPESLAWIREHAHELAAVVAEPVQSRHPALRPREFLTELRTITAASGTALVFDEVVTGFRVHPGGMQAVFGIRADLATYGKVVGGGMPIGILAGKPRFMDALDGGMWQYGDDSIPEVAPTFFAGTFVRHPLVMAAVYAVLEHLKAHGPALQEAITARTADLVERVNADIERRGMTSRIETFGSWFYFNFTAEERLAGLLYYHLRNRGVYIQEGFPCFLTTEHTPADVDHIVSAFRESFDELAAAGIFRAAPRPLPVAVPEFAPTEEQTEIWLAAQLSDDASCAFNESVTLRLDGPLDDAAFRAAWDRVVARHDALRTTLGPTGETMYVAPARPLAFATTDLSKLESAAGEAELAAAADADARRPFDMIAGPLVRAQLFTLAPASHAFIFTAHHIVCDGWSMNVILGEFAAIYDELRAGRTPNLPAPLPFSAYAQMQQQREPAELARLESYWLAQYRDPVQPLELPTDRPRPAIKSYSGATRTASIDAPAYRAIKKAGARNGCTLFVTLLTAFSTLVGRLAGETDVVVGVPAAGQSLLDDAILVGHCVDFLPIRTRWSPEASLGDLLRTVKRSVLDAYEHQSYTLGTLVRTLGIARGTNRLPLTEIQFNLERLADGLSAGGCQIRVAPNAKAFVNFDLFLNVIESEAGLRIDCDYNTDLFDAATIDRWLQHYRTLLDAIAADAEVPAARVSLLSAAERHAVLIDANATADPAFGDATIHALFEARAAQSPDAPAVTAGGETLTYAQLDRRANALANYLRSRISQPQPGPVGICVGRTANALVALLATLKAGTAYIPLDPAHPAARLTHIVATSDVSAVITDNVAGVELAMPDTTVIHLELDAAAIDLAPTAKPPVGVSADDLAYVIFTSGSTGLPKGVEITHRSVTNFLCAMSREPGLTAADTLLAVTTISFDIAGLELFLPLVVGGHVVIAPSEATVDGYALLALLADSRASVMQATPSTWQLLLEAGFVSRPGLKLLVGGEALTRTLADRLLAGGGEVWNMYGPTETTIWSSCARILAGEAPITVGRPILNTQFYVLDDFDELCPVGKSGQLHIGGTGVARGYIKQPNLTAEKFIPNPFATGRVYRTGDAARLLPDGNFQILGRLDQQVKLRGFRIELGEIEAVLFRHGNVAAAAVVLREDVPGDARLVAYYVERPEWPENPESLRRVLHAHLPDYMVPALWVKLDSLPATANGKLDRAALPAPPDGPDVADEIYAEPQTPTERLLAEIWAETLSLSRVGIEDDIFALGADSIQIFRITARANKRGLQLAAKQLMRHRTIGQLARHLDESPVRSAAVVALATRRELTEQTPRGA